MTFSGERPAGIAAGVFRFGGETSACHIRAGSTVVFNFEPSLCGARFEKRTTWVARLCCRLGCDRSKRPNRPGVGRFGRTPDWNSAVIIFWWYNRPHTDSCIYSLLRSDILENRGDAAQVILVRDIMHSAFCSPIVYFFPFGAWTVRELIAFVRCSGSQKSTFFTLTAPHLRSEEALWMYTRTDSV